jgi:hypothetical protein
VLRQVFDGARAPPHDGLGLLAYQRFDKQPRASGCANGRTTAGLSWAHVRSYTVLGRQLTSANLCGSCHNILLPVFDNAGNLLRASYVQSTHLEWTNYATLTLKGLDPAHLPAGLTQVPFVPPSPLPAVVILGSLAVLILGAGASSADASMRGKSRERSRTTVPGV